MHPDVEKRWKSVPEETNINFRTMGNLGDRAERAGMRVGPLTTTVIIYLLKKKKKKGSEAKKPKCAHQLYMWGWVGT